MVGKVNKKTTRKKIVVATSGGFDPIHIGHVRMFAAAKKFAGPNSVHVVIINNDNWLKAKKGYAFMPEKERKEIIEQIKGVDRVILTKHRPNPKDMSVSAELRRLRPDFFGNGGDRTNKNIPELALEKEFGMKMIFGVGKGGKVQSSSWLVEKIKGAKKKNRG